MTEGHLLIIPNRHIADYFSVTAEEKRALWAMVDESKKLLDGWFKPDGYNVGINVGTDAGQTIMHCHIRLIGKRDGKAGRHDHEHEHGSPGDRGIPPLDVEA